MSKKSVIGDPPQGWGRCAIYLSHLLNPAGVAILVVGIGATSLTTALVGVTIYALIPGLVLITLARRDSRPDVYDPTPAIRQRMLFAGTVCYLTGYVSSEWFGFDPQMRWIGATFSAGAVVVWGLDRVWKISIHNTSAGGGAVLLTEMSPEFWPFWVMLPLVVGWARWVRRAHDLLQLVAGAALGACLAWLLRGRYL